MPVAAEVIAIIGKSGAKGVARVRCKIIDDKYKDKIIVRNVMGPLREGDIIMIQEQEVAMESIGAIQ